MILYKQVRIDNAYLVSMTKSAAEKERQVRRGRDCGLCYIYRARNVGGAPERT